MKQLLTAFLFVFAGIIFMQSCNSNTQQNRMNDSAAAGEKINPQSQVELGRHLVAVGGCADCHTPKKMGAHGPEDDSSLFLSGHPHDMPPPMIAAAEIAKGIAATTTQTAWVGPWGISYSANLTPDSTGLASWTEDQFVKCIRQNLHKGIDGSRPIMPPMPVLTINNYTTAELKAMFAYLKSIKAIHNVVPEYAPPAGAQK